MLRSSLRRTLVSSRARSPRRFYPASAALLANDSIDESSSPPGSNSPGPHNLPPPKMNGEDEHISDQEWELRTGRALDILQQTLPTFFNTGLSATNYHLPLHIHKLLGSSHKGKERADEPECETCAEEGIYARTIRLEYTPPVALPAPLPRMLKVEGLPLYVASSAFLRHGMHALYTDLAVALRKIQVHAGRPSASTPLSPTPPAPSDDKRTGQGKQRERSVTIGLLVSGVGRLGLGNGLAEWNVTNTYTFSPRTGRIILHTVNEIHPAPSETVYAAFQSALSSLSPGFGAGGQKGAMNVAQGKTPR